MNHWSDDIDWINDEWKRIIKAASTCSVKNVYMGTRVSFGVIPQEARDMAEQMLMDGVKPFKKPYKIIVNE